MSQVCVLDARLRLPWCSVRMLALPRAGRPVPTVAGTPLSSSHSRSRLRPGGASPLRRCAASFMLPLAAPVSSSRLRLPQSPVPSYGPAYAVRAEAQPGTDCAWVQPPCLFERCHRGSLSLLPLGPSWLHMALISRAIVNPPLGLRRVSCLSNMFDVCSTSWCLPVGVSAAVADTCPSLGSRRFHTSCPVSRSIRSQFAFARRLPTTGYSWLTTCFCPPSLRCALPLLLSAHSSVPSLSCIHPSSVSSFFLHFRCSRSARPCIWYYTCPDVLVDVSGMRLRRAS
jgi:hypothetical protein